MPYSDYRPELMGSASLSPEGRFEAGSYQSFTLVYTAGVFGLDDTGSLKIGFRFATDFGPVQFDDPSAPGYTTIEASNGAELSWSWEFKRNIRPWSRALYIGVKKHFLAPGDTITIRFGDQRQGSPGIRLQTFCETEFEFRVFADPIATYDYVPISRSPKITVGAGPAHEWLAALPSLRAVGDAFRLAVKANDKWGNPSDLVDQHLRLKPNMTVKGLPETVHFPPDQFALFLEDLSVDQPGTLVIDIESDAGELLARSTPLKVEEAPGKKHFWGDLHGQSNETLGTNTAREYFLFGRDRAFLDICSHQGNDFQMTQEFWSDLNELTAELDEPDRFVCIPGYEWSANTSVGGDRNVFYRHEGRPMYRSSHAQIPDLGDEETDAHEAKALFEKLKGEDCVMYAHCGGRYADITYAHDGGKEHAVEVHSSWGTFEWLLHDAFKMNYRVGVVCNSDGHKGRVGASYPGASFFGALGGLTCFALDKLDRDNVFQAIRRRHHYGTTGTRMFLSTRIHLEEPGKVYLSDPALGPAEFEEANDLVMGDIAEVGTDSVTFDVETIGSSPVVRIDVFDGPDLISTHRPFDQSDCGKRIRIIYEGAEYRGRARTTNWNGELKISSNKVLGARMFNNWNQDRGVELASPEHVTWKAVTTGNFGGIDLMLDDADAGTLEISTGPANVKVDVKDIGVEDARFEAGGLDRAIRLMRLPETMDHTHVTHSVIVPVRPKGDTRLYARITQEDGHRAWSSPIYLFRG